MKKLNNNGFAISTILFSVLIIFISVLAVSYATIVSNPDKKKNKCPDGCNNDNCICPKEYEQKSEEKCSNEFIIGTEHFCVLSFEKNSSNKEYAVALAKYGLNLGCKSGDAECSHSRFISGEPEGLQSKKTFEERAKGTVAALNQLNVSSTEYGFYDMINVPSKVTRYNQTTLRNIDELVNGITTDLRKYVNNYKTKLSSINTANNLGITEINVRLLNLDDLNNTNNFSCKDPFNKKIIEYNNNYAYGDNTWNCVVSSDKEWLYWGTYYTGVANKGGQEPLYVITISGSSIAKDATGTSDDINVIRPVIEIPKSDFDKLPKA